MTVVKKKQERGSVLQKGTRTVASGVSSVQIGDKHQKGVIQIAGYKSMSASDKRVLRLGKGFVLVPDEERARQRIDAYPYLVR